MEISQVPAEQNVLNLLNLIYQETAKLRFRWMKEEDIQDCPRTLITLKSEEQNI